MSVEVVKRSGLREPFKTEKVKQAVIRAGATEELAEKVLNKVETRLYDGITTRDIYKTAFRILDKERHSLASVYDLKRAIMRLGPAGYSFETYIGEILKENGHQVQLRQNIQGNCVKHEIDVVSEETPGSYKLVECKYHNKEGIYTGLKEALYTYARFIDMCEGWKTKKCSIQFTSVLLVTNTKFSHNAVEYSNCKGMGLLGWRYPKGSGINSLIDSKKLYPLTILRNIDPVSKRKFSHVGIMMIKDLLYTTAEEISMKTDIHEKKVLKIMDEARTVASQQPV